MADITKLRRNLEREGFRTSYFETAEEACAYLNQELDGTTIGFGGSQTVRDMGLYEQLASHNTCIWHWDKEKNVIPKDATDAAVYILSLIHIFPTRCGVLLPGRGRPGGKKKTRVSLLPCDASPFVAYHRIFLAWTNMTMDIPEPFLGFLLEDKTTTDSLVSRQANVTY